MSEYTPVDWESLMTDKLQTAQVFDVQFWLWVPLMHMEQEIEKLDVKAVPFLTVDSVDKLIEDIVFFESTLQDEAKSKEFKEELGNGANQRTRENWRTVARDAVLGGFDADKDLKSIGLDFEERSNSSMIMTNSEYVHLMIQFYKLRSRALGYVVLYKLSEDDIVERIKQREEAV